jgi:hypothetical protein
VPGLALVAVFTGSYYNASANPALDILYRFIMAAAIPSHP